LSLIEHTRHGYRPKNAVLVPGASGGRQPQPVATAAQAAPGLVIYRFTHSLYYANCGQFADEISFLADTAEPPLRWLCLDASGIDDVDYSAAETFRSVHAKLTAQGIRLVVAEEIEDLKSKAGYRLRELFGEDAFYDHLEDVVKQYRQQFDLR
jgi:MFS superfamily sulfate permease-like transporter